MSTMVLIELAVKPESVEDMKTLMKELLPDTRAYDGCQSVDFYDNTETKGNMVLYEIWDSRAHQERYLQWRSETGTLAPLQAAGHRPAQDSVFRQSGCLDALPVAPFLRRFKLYFSDI